MSISIGFVRVKFENTLECFFNISKDLSFSALQTVGNDSSWHVLSGSE